MKEILWIGIREKSRSHLEMCTGFVHNAPPISQENLKEKLMNKEACTRIKNFAFKKHE
jgi:hypothetical protein